MKVKMDAMDIELKEDCAAREGKYLTFALAHEEYGIGILKVSEIIGVMPVTPIPKTPGYIKGVINLRGKVVPVIDLRLKFGLPGAESTERTCIIVVEIISDTGKILIGMMVDSVSEVINIRAAEIEDTPNFGSRVNTAYLLGMAKTGQGVKILLDLDEVLAGDDPGGIMRL